MVWIITREIDESDINNESHYLPHSLDTNNYKSLLAASGKKKGKRPLNKYLLN